MSRLSREILERRYKEVRETRDKYRDENLVLAREIKKLNKQVSKLENDLIELSRLLDVKIENEVNHI